MELSERKLKILQAVIEEYSLTGAPVGSRNLSRKGDLALSAATIRNEMADLEEMGYLEKAHASSGRRPNVHAYRLYVDQLMRVHTLTREDMARVRSHFDRHLNEVSEVLDAAAEAISDLTAHVGLVSDPERDGALLKRVQLVKVSEVRAVAIFATENGQVSDSVIAVPAFFTSAELEQLSDFLSARLLDVPTCEAAARIKEMARNAADGQKLVMDAVFEAMNNCKDTQGMHLRGKQNIWRYPECRDVGKAEKLMMLLEQTDSLASLMRRGRDLEFSIRIGSELAGGALPELSVVTATYRAGSRQAGSFGIIGPIRMDYGRVLSVLRFVGLKLSEALSDILEAGRQ